MKIDIISEHSVCLDLIPPSGNILDAGCRDFNFTDAMQKLGHTVYSVDCDDIDTDRRYFRLAISGFDGRCDIKRVSDPQATSIDHNGSEIKKLTIKSFTEFLMIEKFDLVKLDIEGEEYDVLTFAQHPIAKQISVEFHAHTGKQGKAALDFLLDDVLSEFYTIHNRVWEKRHGCSENYWDILLVSK